MQLRENVRTLKEGEREVCLSKVCIEKRKGLSFGYGTKKKTIPSGRRKKMVELVRRNNVSISRNWRKSSFGGKTILPGRRGKFNRCKLTRAKRGRTITSKKKGRRDSERRILSLEAEHCVYHRPKGRGGERRIIPTVSVSQKRLDKGKRRAFSFLGGKGKLSSFRSEGGRKCCSGNGEKRKGNSRKGDVHFLTLIEFKG